MNVFLSLSKQLLKTQIKNDIKQTKGLELVVKQTTLCFCYWTELLPTLCFLSFFIGPSACLPLLISPVFLCV